MANASDAEVVLKLYDLRREAKMREARNWFLNFNPASFEEFGKVAFAFGAPENAFFRQVTSYWETAAALVIHGAVNEELFHDTQGEMWFVYTKLKPFLPQFRQQFKAPEIMKHMETVATRTAKGQERVRTFEERFKMFAEMRNQQAQAQAAK